MGNDPLEVGVQELGKPLEMAVARGVTGVNDGGYLLGHIDFAVGFVCVDQHFFDQVCGEKQPVGLQQRLISLLITAPRGHGVNGEQRICRLWFHSVGGLLILSYQRLPVGGQDVPGAL